MSFKLLIGLITLSLVFHSSFGQEAELNLKGGKDYYRYDKDFLPATFHKARRDSLRALMPDSTVAVFFSSPERKRSNDVYYEYHQDPNIYYLSGLREPNSMLIIFKENQTIDSVSTNELLFMQERNPAYEVWNGRRLGLERAREELEIKLVKDNADFLKDKFDSQQFKRVFYAEPEALETQDTSETDNLNGLIYQFKKGLNDVSSIESRHLMVMMARLRQVKTEEELVLLRKAITITCEAQNELMKQISSDMAEYQTEAIIEYFFKKNGAEYPGFPSIQGSGENSCVLHYVSNRRPLNRGGLLVSDVGAEYHGYTADVTRTIPPSGKFSKEEKIIYNLVLKAQEAGIEAAQKGNSFWAPHQAAQKVIQEGLMKLGIIKNEMEVRKYFMHGTSHYLGLDVHDAGLYLPLTVSNVITVEPGIYISEESDCDPKWWNIGVRIEDDILITENGPEILSISSPRTVNEIEKLMSKDNTAH